MSGHLNREISSTIRFPRCILGACCIPWDHDEHFNESIFRRHVRILLRQGTRHLYIFGTAGEGYAVGAGEFDEIVNCFVEEMRAHGAEPMVGIVDLSLSTMLERIERSAVKGVNQFQISFPSWGTLSDPEVDRFFAEICNSFPECQFLHYNTARAKRQLTHVEYSRLAERHPNLVATKITTSSTLELSALARHAPTLRHFVTEPGFAYVSLFAEVGLLVSYASTNWNAARSYFEAACAGRVKELLYYQSQLDAVLASLQELAVTEGFHMDGAFDKLFAKLHQPEFPLKLRSPYVGASDNTFDRFRSYLRERHSAWYECE